MRKRLLTRAVSVLALLLSTACSAGSDAEPQEQSQHAKKLADMTAREIIDTSLSSMEKMKGHRWESFNRQQYSFQRQPGKNTRVDWKQRVFVTEKPVNIQAAGTLTVARELVSQTTPQRWYVTDGKEYLFTRNRWYKKDRSGAGDEMKAYADPVWTLRTVKESADVYQVDRAGKKVTLTVGLTGKEVDPFIDRRSPAFAAIDMKKKVPVGGQRMKIRIVIDNKSFRLDKVEQAVEFTMDLGREKVKTRQEWTHDLQGEVKRITVPEKIRQNALTYPDPDKEETIPSR